MRAPVLLAALVTGLVTLAGCGSARPPPELTPEEARAIPVQVLVFDFVETHGSPRLGVTPQTEYVDRADADDPLLTVVRTLLRHQPQQGHESLWTGLCRPGPDVTAVEEGDPVVVTLADFAPDASGNAVCDLSEEGWRVQRQQLAWTVAAALRQDVAVRVVDAGGREVLPSTRPERAALAPGVLAGGYGRALGWSTGGRPPFERGRLRYPSASDDTRRARVADHDYDVRAELVKQLIHKVDEDPFPSPTMLNQIEALLTPEELPRYARVLMSKVEDEQFPSIDMIKRLAGLT